MGTKLSEVDQNIMQELLNKPDVKPGYDCLSDEAKAWYVELLVTEGIYDAYLKQRSHE